VRDFVDLLVEVLESWGHQRHHRSMTNVDHYTYRITWSAMDNEFAGLVPAFPLLSWLAASQIDARTGIRGERQSQPTREFAAAALSS
ncbi:MAG: hypothetical protein LH471_04510, partial [Salinibacterium sp.]|nr:hypothetical protein [Salinibacterium sp.]